MKTQVIGFLSLHVLFFFSIFDIHFKSPVISVSRRFSPGGMEPPCRRVFVFVADGMRARTFYEHWEEKAPFIKKMANLNGMSGISHTRVPTESRPGHVALFAGMYEDPSAITKGWKENPVDFDTVFNQSSRSYAWGSPDILPMFSRGTPHMKSWMYAHEFEDFSANDLSKLDTWVFERVIKLFERASDREEHDYDLQMNLRKEGLIFFLHLLASDTNGHAHRPKSNKYINNIRVLNEGVEKVYTTVQKYWRRDSRTAFIFTSDHGMTDWGSHGSGSDDETKTPIVLWGAGIKNSTDLFSIKQADVTPLIASLLGINFPGNSEGRLPSQLLNSHPIHIIEGEIANSRQIYEQLSSLRQMYSQSLFHYEKKDVLNDKDFERLIAHVRDHLSKGQIRSAYKISSDLFNRAFDGLKYYQRYHRGWLYISITFSYISFMVYVAFKILKSYTFLFMETQKIESQRSRTLTLWTGSFGVAFIFTWLSCQPWYTFLYFGSPLFILSMLLNDTLNLKLSPGLSFTTTCGRNLLKSIFIIICICIIVQGIFFTFYDRRILCLSGALVTLVQALYFHEFKHTRTYLGKLSLTMWIFMNLCISAFAFQPTIGNESSPTLVFLSSGLTWVMYLFGISMSEMENKIRIRLILFSLILPTSGACVYISSENMGMRPLIHPISWIIGLGATPLSILLTPGKMMIRLLSVTMSLSAFYTLLSLSHEVLFLLCLNGALLSWLWMEHMDSYSHKSIYHEDLSHKIRNIIELKDIFRSSAFIYFCIASFFGTGNIASINSFDPKSILTFLTVFSPFVMSLLLLLKILIPIFNVGLYLVCIRSLTRLNTLCLLSCVLLISDVLGLQFFFQVSDVGSWLEIGSSLSNYVIAQAIVILMQCLQVLDILFK
ncbi:GPI ethanolamine phosphate transferase 1 [Lepeophtheirus salmonis]|uniref:GPI ethanolamine phosphate transferase 1 n=1 Tax=Lepeophtheirus salmonis TaxID=72036 RepID=UPI001AE9C7A7|nr:GPI ethanolamine phosphate transferase 1-like [Lepeophtheirus salmonis]